MIREAEIAEPEVWKTGSSGGFRNECLQGSGREYQSRKWDGCDVTATRGNCGEPASVAFLETM